MVDRLIEWDDMPLVDESGPAAAEFDPLALDFAHNENHPAVKLVHDLLADFDLDPRVDHDNLVTDLECDVVSRRTASDQKQRSHPQRQSCSPHHATSHQQPQKT
jgi:hypothetical protein